MRLNSIEQTAINILRNRGYLEYWTVYITDAEYMRLRQIDRGAVWEWAFKQALMIWRKARQEQLLKKYPDGEMPNIPYERRFSYEERDRRTVDRGAKKREIQAGIGRA